MGVAPVLQQKFRESFPDYGVGTAKVASSLVCWNVITFFLLLWMNLYHVPYLSKPVQTAGIIAGTLSHPLDTIKTCMQGDTARKTYGSVMETAAVLFKVISRLDFHFISSCA
jgi:hypothetical protein